MAFGTQSAKIRTATTWEPSTNMVLYIVERSISMKITLLFIRVQSSLSVSIALVCSFCVLSCASLLPTLSFRIGLSSGTFRFNHQVNAIVHSISYKKSNLFFFGNVHASPFVAIHSFIRFVLGFSRNKRVDAFYSSLSLEYHRKPEWLNWRLFFLPNKLLSDFNK